MTNPIQDIMQYYFYNFFTVYIVFLLAAGISLVSFKKKKLLKYSIPINILTAIALFLNAIFMGVLADNAAPNYQVWSIQNTIFLIILCFLLVVQVFLFFKNRKKGVL